MNINRIIWIVLDSVGIGEARDAAKFGDEGADTLGHTAGANGGLNIPNMVKLGIGNIDGAHNLERCDNPIGCFGKLAEISAGKDTTIGHWRWLEYILRIRFLCIQTDFRRILLMNLSEKQVCRVYYAISRLQEHR
jgi:phosphopentomutase